jgi:hypothetical protein
LEAEIHMRTLSIMVLAITGLVWSASAQTGDVPGVYSTTKNRHGCKASSAKVVIREGLVAGPGFRCTISHPRPAGTGLEAYDAICSYAGRPRSGVLALDTGNYYHHIELSLPGKGGTWIPLYPCGYFHKNKGGLPD